MRGNSFPGTGSLRQPAPLSARSHLRHEDPRRRHLPQDAEEVRCVLGGTSCRFQCCCARSAATHSLVPEHDFSPSLPARRPSSGDMSALEKGESSLFLKERRGACVSDPGWRSRSSLWVLATAPCCGPCCGPPVWSLSGRRRALPRPRLHRRPQGVITAPAPPRCSARTTSTPRRCDLTAQPSSPPTPTHHACVRSPLGSGSAWLLPSVAHARPHLLAPPTLHSSRCNARSSLRRGSASTRLGSMTRRSSPSRTSSASSRRSTSGTTSRRRGGPGPGRRAAALRGGLWLAHLAAPAPIRRLALAPCCESSGLWGDHNRVCRQPNGRRD